MPQTYTCVAGDTYESIASNLYGDATLASYIDAANGGGVLIAGQTLVVPQLISVHNKAGMARPYYQLLQIIQGSLTPHLNTPQPPPPHHHDGFFGFLVKAIVIAVVCVAVPELAPGLIPGIAGALGVSEAIVTAVGVGLVDAAAQGLCIGLGIQDRFSMAELATTIITAGFGGQLGPLSAEFTTTELMEYIVQAGLVNVEEQLAEMALGIRHQFDLAGVALAMGSAGLSSEIKIANPLERSIVADLSVAAISGVVRGRIDVENLAIQLISDSARYAVQQSYANSSVSDEYHQSQRASRGEGHITQTTVDQQWESHLINDAEFTANAPLPSVTFDVNDSYVSQQLGQRVGEEVSHFYHPTPPPARNPSGFWQRLEQRYKNSFERQALIAEGRASAYSEVMRESLGHAAANEQNYLDLGYSESIVETRVAEWMSPIVAAASPAVIKLPIVAAKAYSLVNRWGFFGGNKAKSSEQAIIRARVEANVAETRAGSNTSSYKVLTAKENQLVKGYHPDDWTMIQLRKGDVLYGGRPGQSNYYTNIDTVLASEGDTTALSRSLQIEPHPTKGFRPGIGEYVVQRDIRVPGGIVRSNPMLGPGGTQQYFINNYSNLLSLRNEYTLEEFYESQLSSSILRP